MLEEIRDVVTTLRLVPRWNGDASFMPVLADTKVLPELLSSAYKKLKQALGTLRDEASGDFSDGQLNTVNRREWIVERKRPSH